MRTINTIRTEWNEVTKLHLFEVEVINNRTGENDYIIFDITIENDKFVATHEALTEQEKNSTKVAYKVVTIDPDFSLDENLQELYSECIDAIYNSDFFTLAE